MAWCEQKFLWPGVSRSFYDLVWAEVFMAWCEQKFLWPGVSRSFYRITNCWFIGSYYKLSLTCHEYGKDTHSHLHLFCRVRCVFDFSQTTSRPHPFKRVLPCSGETKSYFYIPGSIWGYSFEHIFLIYIFIRSNFIILWKFEFVSVL